MLEGRRKAKGGRKTGDNEREGRERGGGKWKEEEREGVRGGEEE